MAISFPVPAKTLVPGPLFDRLAARIADERMVAYTMAARIVDQALAFLAASARVEGPLVPSEPVALGWHTFLLYTREYAEFCDRVAGRFIHHVPHDAPAAQIGRSSPTQAHGRAVEAIEDAGYVVDHELWPLTAASCGNCHEEGNCSASGGSGDENTDTRKK